MMRIFSNNVWVSIVAAMSLPICMFAGGGEEKYQEPRPQSQPCETTVYSDVKYIPEAGDVVGTEIVLRRCRGSERVSGQWDLYEGFPPPLVTHLSGTLRKSKLQMAAPEARLRPTLKAELEKDSLKGELRWYVGATPQTEVLNLRRVAGRLVDLIREGRQDEIEYSNQQK